MLKGGVGRDGARRSRASRSAPSGLCRVEAFGNSFADSVSFRFPSRPSLDGFPAPSAKCAMSPSAPKRDDVKSTERDAGYLGWGRPSGLEYGGWAQDEHR